LLPQNTTALYVRVSGVLIKVFHEQGTVIVELVWKWEASPMS